MRDGYIAVQAEGSSTQFKSIEILDLVGCMDRSKPAYRSYIVKNDPQACAATGIASRFPADEGTLLARDGRMLVARGQGVSIAEPRRVDGSRLALVPGSRAFAPDRAGIYLVSLLTSKGIRVRKAGWYF